MGKVVVRGAEVRQQVIDILKNGGSLDDAASVTGFTRNYVRQIGAKNGIRFKRGTYGKHQTSKYDRDTILELYKAGKKVKDIADVLGICETTVYRSVKAAGLTRLMTEAQRDVEWLRKQGLCCYEISEKLGKKPKDVRKIANAIGMPFTEEEKKLSKSKSIEKQYGDEKQRVEKQRFFIACNFPEWEYISGYIASDGFVKLKHKPCGAIVNKSAVSVRHNNNLKCPECAKRLKEDRERAKKQEQETRKREKEAAKSCHQKTILFKTCKECGAPFITFRAGMLFCSDVCKRKSTNRKHDKRIQRAAVIDDDITLKKLMARDKCTCWICGGKCNPDDHTTNTNGAFIVGPDYPSIDHVYPLSRGGPHTWENVKLAHHYCNTLKSDKVVGYA